MISKESIETVFERRSMVLFDAGEKSEAERVMPVASAVPGGSSRSGVGTADCCGDSDKATSPSAMTAGRETVASLSVDATSSAEG